MYDVFWPLLQDGSKDRPNFLHECRGQQDPLFEPDGFSEKILNPGFQGIKYPKKVCPLLFRRFLQNSSKDFPNFLQVEDNRAHRLSQMVFLKNVLIQDYGGLSVQKRCFLLFCPFLYNDSKDIPILLHDCRGQQGPTFEYYRFSEKILNPALWCVFFILLSFPLQPL